MGAPDIWGEDEAWINIWSDWFRKINGEEFWAMRAEAGPAGAKVIFGWRVNIELLIIECEGVAIKLLAVICLRGLITGWEAKAFWETNGGFGWIWAVPWGST